jgi:hypothetical protein
MGDILLSFKEAIDLVMLFLEILIGLTDRLMVVDFSLESDSIWIHEYH